MKKAIIIMFALVLGTCSRPPTTLEEVLASGKLRVVTRYAPTTYYEGAQGEDGPEYQLVQGFARYLSDKYDRVIEPDFSPIGRFTDLLPQLERGYAHLAAAGLTVTPERRDRVAFGKSYQTVEQVLVYRLHTGKPRTISDLQGKNLQVLAGSSFIDTLHQLRRENPEVELNWTESADAEISELLVAVDSQQIDFTVADSTDFKVHRAYMPDLRIGLTLKDSDQIAWATNPYRSKALLREINAYFAELENSGELQRILDRYYGHTDQFDYVGTRAFVRDAESRLDQYRELFQAAGAESDVDWRILAAIGYQESHWDPAAVSPTGVRGLMQLTKVTAGSLGVEDRENPAEAIPAAATYYASLRDRLSDIPEPERTWFALAAYNVGFGHMQDARSLTEQRGGNPDSWLDVKENLPLLALRSHYSNLPHGYARGWEPVKYVDNVRTYYQILHWMTKDEDAPATTDRINGLQIAALPDFFSNWF